MIIDEDTIYLADISKNTYNFLNKNIKISTTASDYDDIEEFVDVYLQVLCAFVGEQYKLTGKERTFLMHCMLFKRSGGNLSDFYALRDYILEKKFCSAQDHVSMYKFKISLKKWARTGKDFFELAPKLVLPEGSFGTDFKLNFNIKDVLESVA